MTTVFTHAVVPLALGVALGPQRVSGRLLAAGVLASVAPDFDVLGMHLLALPYGHALGHRGASHSLLASLLWAALAAGCWRCLRGRSALAVFGFVFASMVSHPLLDMLTTGGMGVALWWPVSDERLFAPWRFIHVSPMGVRQVWGGPLVQALLSELRWVWLPAFGAAGAVRAFSSWRGRLPHLRSHLEQAGHGGGAGGVGRAQRRHE
jgi:inner membrane protein